MNGVTSEDLIARAIRATGLDDFGSDGFREGLARSLAGFSETPLTPAGREAMLSQLYDNLCNRLRIEDWYRTHPEIDSLEIEGPVLVTGLPRTGTSATVALLALDPQFRFPRQWECAAPIPPPVAGTEDVDPRAVAAREQARAYDLSALHISDPDGPEEDLALLAGLDMRSYYGALPMPDSFIDWWISDSFESTYAYHERVLRLLQSQRPPNRWLLKSPLHIFRLESFAARYPRAKFIMTHKHPGQTIPSTASLFWNLYKSKIEADSISKAWIGRRVLSFWSEGMRRGMAARERIGNDRFIDVYNADIVRDPVGVFQTIYGRLDLKLDPGTAAAVERFQKENPPGKDGGHKYSLSDYGLDADMIGSGFSDYIDRFGL